MTFHRFGPGDWWMRIGPVGWSVEPLTDHRPLFSERLGFRRRWHRFGRCFGPLGWFEKPRRTS